MSTYRYTIGVDCAKDDYTVAVFRVDNQHVIAIGRFANTIEGIQQFQQWLHQHQILPNEALFCLEATGVYSELLAYQLHAQAWLLALEAPNKVKRAFRKRQKNDPIDAQQIAEYAWRYADQLTLWSPADAVVEQLRTLLALREQLVEQRTAQQNAFIAFSRKVVQSPTVRTVYQTTIAHLGQQITAIDREIRRLLEEHPTLGDHARRLQTIPGVGLLLVANLALVTRGFTQTPSAGSLACFLGICPHEYTSGSSVRRTARSSGYGPERLRKLLYLAALSVRQHYARFRAYFEQKVAEGKPKRLVLNNIANKLVRILCAMIATETSFDPMHRPVPGWQRHNPSRSTMTVLA